MENWQPRSFRIDNKKVQKFKANNVKTIVAITFAIVIVILALKYRIKKRQDVDQQKKLKGLMSQLSLCEEDILEYSSSINVNEKAISKLEKELQSNTIQLKTHATLINEKQVKIRGIQAELLAVEDDMQKIVKRESNLQTISNSSSLPDRKKKQIFEKLSQEKKELESKKHNLEKDIKDLEIENQKDVDIHRRLQTRNAEIQEKISEHRLQLERDKMNLQKKLKEKVSLLEAKRQLQ
jgi:chromosome segregation ATPase